jgi:uncharacterized membrane protein YsdA (DUF1294 family)
MTIIFATLVLGFPACAVWAARTGGAARLWSAAGAALAVLAGLALASASAHLGNRLAAHQGYWRTVLGTLLAGAFLGGLPILAGTLTVHLGRHRVRAALVLYLLAAAAALVALVLGVIAGLNAVSLLP